MLHVDEAGNHWSYHLFKYGKNKDGYWTGLKMLDHKSDVLDMVTVLYPEHKPVGLFDWSSCHDCKEVGAPMVSRMNLGVGGTRKGEELAPMDPVACYTVKEEKYRPIDMLHVDEAGNHWSYHLFKYGKNKDGYWTGLKMLDHKSDVLDMVTVLYPEHKPVGLFDWSSCHDCKEVGAPMVSRMNLGVGGTRKGEELAPMDPVVILEDTPLLKKGTVQHLVFQRGDDPPFASPDLLPAEYEGKLKGMRQILAERGLLKKGMSRMGGTGENKDLSMSMEHVLGEQKDPKEVESSLVLLMARHGGICLMLPNHCECNPIKLVWGRAKQWTRKNCTYSLECLRKNVPLSFKAEKDRQAEK
ncbi:unnamed protein product [Ectocarpus sp. CCAP 1310/34]|nr:unnamed protein product [Ectocarpus sp. CCAP 1310/34]